MSLFNHVFGDGRVQGKEGVQPDWYCVALDETQYWNLADDDKPYVEKMLGVYIYDRASYTYCCELTPSYLLCHVTNVAVCKADTPDDARERINAAYECGGDGEDFYMHVRTVEGIPDEQKHHYGNVEDWQDEKDRGEAIVREYYQGNPHF